MGTQGHIRWALCSLLGAFLCLAPPAPAADVVTTTVSPQADPSSSRVEIVQVVFEPGEEAEAVELLRRTAAEALTGNGSLPIDILCSTGGASSSAACREVRKDLGEVARRAGTTFEEVAPEGGGTSPPPARVPAASGERPQPSDWKGVLTMVRTVASGVTVGLTAALSKGAEWPAALAVGATAGAWSGLMQYFNRPRLNWQSHSHWLGFSPPEPHEQAGLFKRYFKRAIQTGLYATLLSGAYYLTGLNPDLVSLESLGRVGVTVAESLYTQTAWEALNQEWTEAAIRRNPQKAYLYKRLSGLGSLVQALVNVTANALNIGGVHMGSIHLGTLISGTVGTAGTITYLWRSPPAFLTAPAGAACRLFYGVVGRVIGR